MPLFLSILVGLFLILTLLFRTMGEQPKRFRASYYVALIQLILALVVVPINLLAPSTPFSCYPGFAGVYLNPLLTLIDTVSLLTLLPTAIRTRSTKTITLYLTFVVTRLAIHVGAGSAHYWVVSHCTA